jgi:hypothetical protein
MVIEAGVCVCRAQPMEMISPRVHTPRRRGRQRTCRGKNPDHRSHPASEHAAILGMPFLTVKCLHSLVQIEGAHGLRNQLCRQKILLKPIDYSAVLMLLE